MIKRPTVYWPLIMALFVVLMAGKGGTDSSMAWAAMFFLPLGYLIGLWAQRRIARKKPLDYKTPTRIFVQSAICLGLMFGVLVCAYLDDVARDRATLVEVTKDSPLFKDITRTDKVGKVTPSDSLAVLRIRYLKDGMAIHVRRQDGVDGWVFASPYVKTKMANESRCIGR